MKVTNIKKCPFCGSSAKLIGTKKGPCSLELFVECIRCHATGEKFEDNFVSFTLAETKEKAVNAWNDRKPVQDAIDRLFFLESECIKIAEDAALNNYSNRWRTYTAKAVAYDHAAYIIAEEGECAYADHN